MSAAPEFVVKNYFYLQRISFKFHTLILSHTCIFRVFCHLGYFLALFENFWLLILYDFSYLQRISTARRPIAQASRNGDAPGREIVKIVHPLLDSENIRIDSTLKYFQLIWKDRFVCRYRTCFLLQNNWEFEISDHPDIRRSHLFYQSEYLPISSRISIPFDYANQKCLIF